MARSFLESMSCRRYAAAYGLCAARADNATSLASPASFGMRNLLSVPLTARAMTSASGVGLLRLLS